MTLTPGKCSTRPTEFDTLLPNLVKKCLFVFFSYLVKGRRCPDGVVDDLQVDDVVEGAHAGEGAVLVAPPVREGHGLDQVVLRVLQVNRSIKSKQID